MARLLGAVPVPYRLDRGRGFEPDVAHVQSLLGPRTRALVVNSPGNPTGSVVGRQALAALAELAERHGFWLVSDECYDQLVLEGEHVSTAAVGAADRVVSVFSFSKTYAMTGWRVGYAVAPPPLAKMLARAQEPVISCPSTVGQKAAEAALTGPQDVVGELREAFRRRRDLALAALDARGVGYARPRGAFYLMVDVPGPSDAFARRLLDEDGVAVVSGSAFGDGGEGMVRVSLTAADDVVGRGVERLAAAIEVAA
jgi:aspartate/methionine/tyrosine aminotransferase